LLGGGFIPRHTVPGPIHQTRMETSASRTESTGVVEQLQGLNVVVGGAQAVLIPQAKRCAGLTVPVGAGTLAVGEGGAGVYGIGDARDLREIPARGGFCWSAVLLRVLLRVRGASLADLLRSSDWQAREHHQQQHGGNIALLTP
jgi:hypothetical protein